MAQLRASSALVQDQARSIFSPALTVVSATVASVTTAAASVGATVGKAVGVAVGMAVGTTVGAATGGVVGNAVGESEATTVRVISSMATSPVDDCPRMAVTLTFS